MEEKKDADDDDDENDGERKKGAAPGSIVSYFRLTFSPLFLSSSFFLFSSFFFSANFHPSITSVVPLLSCCCILHLITMHDP